MTLTTQTSFQLSKNNFFTKLIQLVFSDKLQQASIF